LESGCAAEAIIDSWRSSGKTVRITQAGCRRDGPRSRHGLDIEATGLHRVTSPRHASVLLVIGAIPPSLRESAAVVYAQMARPRVLFVLGTDKLFPLPAADVMADLSQQELIKGVRQLRSAFAEGAFYPEVSDFDAPVLQVRIEYTCLCGMSRDPVPYVA